MHALNKAKSGFFNTLSTLQFIGLVTIINLVLYHYPLLSYVSANIDMTTLYSASVIFSIVLVIILFSVLFSALMAFISPTVMKFFWVIALLVNAFATYFLTTFQVNLSRSMMGNILNTRSSEAFDFLHPTLFIYLFLLGVIPSWFILRIAIKQTGRLRLITYLLLTLSVISLLIYVNSSSWLWIDKHAKNLGGRIVPWSYIINTARHINQQSKGSEIQTLLPEAIFKNNDKTVVILVIGETARAQDFSLYGYSRDTNPLLKKSGVIALKNAQSCATYTTASVACILSHLGKPSTSFEPLPSYLKRFGADVIWRTSNWGEPKIDVTEYSEVGDLVKKCSDDRCKQDEVLLTDLADRINASKKQKVFIILHTRGSHGPSYYTRYSKDFDVFKPVCKTVEVNNCTAQELKNAYDNSILYTDYFLTKTITLLKNLGNVSSTLLYISDHGESLGEYGLYLHGTPYSVAPDFQKKVPFILWMSDTFKKSHHVSEKSIDVNGEHSHANIFHSVMGAFSMQSRVYNKSKDIFNSSRP